MLTHRKYEIGARFSERQHQYQLQHLYSSLPGLFVLVYFAGVKPGLTKLT